ncbi:MAG TPA: carboxypeptidase-like regulatory domain-containing protein, partial [Prolixibacteraceae bacterium]|nr:carboxypeptidase-like regulatory domain-containing protein [Prolixibacteraceae bacterium]
MIRKVGFIVIGLIISNYSIADNRYVMGVVREKDNPALPVVGANIYWAGTSKGTTSDSMGAFRLALENALPDARLVVSFVGFRTDTLFAVPGNELQVLLERNTELDEVLIRERRKGVYLSTLDPVQSHKVTATELQKAACCNLSESFETNASVDIAFTDAVTGAQQIRMLGLSGTYVQTLSENMPMLRGLAAPYGLGWVPGPWMESIQISKGTSSVVNGYEALTGQINVEFKKPGGTEVLHFNAYGNDALKTEANLNYSHSFSDSLMTTVFLHGENQWKAIDLNGDRFMDLPNVRQINFMNRWNFIPKRGGHREIGIKALNELRRSGQVGAFGDPGAGLYGIEIETRRYEIFAKNGILFDRPGTSLGLQFSGSFHDQQSVYGLKQYTGTQYSVYFNAIYQGHFGSDLHTYKTGISFLGDWLDERLDDRPFRNQELVPGGFF